MLKQWGQFVDREIFTEQLKKRTIKLCSLNFKVNILQMNAQVYTVTLRGLALRSATLNCNVNVVVDILAEETICWPVGDVRSVRVRKGHWQGSWILCPGRGVQHKDFPCDFLLWRRMTLNSCISHHFVLISQCSDSLLIVNGLLRDCAYRKRLCWMENWIRRKNLKIGIQSLFMSIVN